MINYQIEKRKKALESIKTALRGEGYKSGNLTAEYVIDSQNSKYNRVKITSNKFLDNECYIEFMTIESASELIYIMQHLKNNQ